MSMSSLLQALSANLEEVRDSQRRRRHVRRRTGSPGENIGGIPPPPPTPPPGTRPRTMRAIMLPYVNLTTQQNLYIPYMDATCDQACMHIGKGAVPTTAQYNAVLALPALHHGLEFFQLADISANAATMHSKGLDFVSYDMEGGVNGTPTSEINDPAGSFQTAKSICTANSLLLQGAAARATSDAHAVEFAQYCDLFHYQIQGYQEVPATASPPNFYQETNDMVTKVRSVNATCPITVQVSQTRAAEAGLTVVDTWIKRWGEVQPLDVKGISIWFANNTQSITDLSSMVQWWDLNWH